MRDYKTYNDFRRSQNKIAAAWFQQKNFSTHPQYSFILKDIKAWRNNIILPEVADYIETVKADYESKGIPFPFHKYVHHGLSSQAMLFNLLGDSARKIDVTFFKDLFSLPETSIEADSQILFEYSDRQTFNELQSQPTSFDFAIKNKSGKHIFVEAKYIEPEFGGCSTIQGGECDGRNPIDNPQLCYLTHKGRKYWDLMIKHGLHKAFTNTPICPFSVYYQFFREVLFAAENNGHLVLLVDKRNPAFYKSGSMGERGLIPTLTGYLPEHLKQITHTLFIQDVVEKLAQHNYAWIQEFKKKYGIE